MKKRFFEHNIFNKIYRIIKFNMIKLFRSSDGARKVSLGFAIGFGLEMLVIPTAYLMYIIFYPAVKLSRASLSSAIIGNIIGKFTFLPLLLLPFGKSLGEIIFPVELKHVHMHEHPLKDLLNGDFSVVIGLLYGGLQTLIGMAVFGVILGFIAYHLIHYFYNQGKQRRKKKKAAV